MNKNHFLIFFYVLLFTFLFFNTLNTNYIEGDDASTILYHLCGRNNLIQMPYAPYHSGFDSLLKFLPSNNEILLRTTAVYISFLFGFLVLISICLFFQECFRSNTNSKFYFLLLLPFIIPQFIFQSLLLNPTNISFTFTLLSLLFYIKYLKKPQNKLLVISAIFMGISLPFRWSMLVFYPVFVSFFFIFHEFSKKNWVWLIKHLSFFVFFSLIIGFSLILISGYSFTNLINTILFGRQYMANSDRSILSLIAMASSFFTPQLVILLFIGSYLGIKSDFKNLKMYLIIILPLIPFLILGFLPDFKYSISLMPLILVLAYKGYVYVYDKLVLNIGFTTSIFCLRFVGISINLENSMFGPSFTFKNKKTINLNRNVVNFDKNIDKRVKFRSIKPVFESGIYMPTAEGGRPLYGYFYVLFGHAWFNNIENFTKSRDLIINKLQSDNKTIFLQDRKTAYLQADLFRYGYKTVSDFKVNKLNKMYYRDFINGNKTIKLQIIPEGVDKDNYILDYFKNNNNVIFRSSYSSSILKILNQDPDLKFIDVYTVYKEAK